MRSISGNIPTRLKDWREEVPSHSIDRLDQLKLNTQRRNHFTTSILSVQKEKNPLKIETIPVSKINSNPFAGRLSEPDVTDLCLSVTTNGQLSPIKVRRSPRKPGRYEAVYGHRRLLAAKHLKKEGILAEVSDVTDEQ